MRNHGTSTRSLHFSSRISKWLDDDYLVKRGNATDWKSQYRLRHNWSSGSCRISETRVADRQSVPPLMVRFHEAILITVDCTTGLRAWSMKSENQLLATIVLPSEQAGTVTTPTALAVDISSSGGGMIPIAVGFSDGVLRIYHYLVDRQDFVHRHTNFPSYHGAIEAIAYSSPHLITMSDAKLLSLYHFDGQSESEGQRDVQVPLRLLSSMKSHTAWPPLSLAIRYSSNNIFATITYAIPTYLAGWSVGLQELRLTPEGNILESRLASAISQGFTPLFHSQPPSPTVRTDSPLRRNHNWESSSLLSKPTSLSYTHPYILASHSDNTLSFYVVTSDANNLSIGPGYRLWGHTSSVSGAHVGDRGKAVSVSRQGNDLRIWELESGLGHGHSKQRTTDHEKSVRIRPKGRISHNHDIKNDVESEPGCTAQIQDSYQKELTTKNGWVAFDDEKVLLLEEGGQGAQMVVVYDFS